MKIKLRYFASIREALGCSGEEVDTHASNISALRAELMQRSPEYAQALGTQSAVRAALNQTLCDDHALLHEGAEVAFFPPVTGG